MHFPSPEHVHNHHLFSGPRSKVGGEIDPISLKLKQPPVPMVSAKNDGAMRLKPNEQNKTG